MSEPTSNVYVIQRPTKYGNDVFLNILFFRHVFCKNYYDSYDELIEYIIIL